MTLPYDGNPITEPGVYSDVPMDKYHEQLTEGPSISSSGLRTIERQSPAHYYAYSYLNPDKAEKSTPDMNFGKVAHGVLLGDDHFDKHFVIPNFDNWSRNEGKWTVTTKREWKAERIESGQIIVMPSQMEIVRAMGAVLSADPVVAAGALQGDVEQSLVWRDKKTGIWLKARPDILPHDDWVVDYKTIADLAPYKRHQSIMDYGYFQQFALIGEGMAAVGRKIPTNFVLIFQEKKPPYCVVVETLSWEMIKWGSQLNHRALKTFSECLERNEWPGPMSPISDFAGPDWFHKRMQEEEDGNILPQAGAWLDRAMKEDTA